MFVFQYNNAKIVLPTQGRHPTGPYSSVSTMSKEKGKIRESIARCFLEHLPRYLQLKKEGRKTECSLWGDLQLSICALATYPNVNCVVTIPKCKLCGYYASLTSFINLIRDLHIPIYIMQTFTFTILFLGASKFLRSLLIHQYCAIPGLSCSQSFSNPSPASFSNPAVHISSLCKEILAKSLLDPPD